MPFSGFFDKKISAMACLLLALFSLFCAGCLKATSASRAQGFGWDEDLKDPETKSSFGPVVNESEIDKEFCRNVSGKNCFTLAIRIPKKEMIEDLGLSVLALGSTSREIRSRLSEACTAAWADYKVRYRSDLVRKLRKKFVDKIDKMRCVFLFVDEEVADETLPLNENELGMSVRLTKFNLSGQSTQAKIRDVGLNFDSKAVEVGFRSTSVFGMDGGVNSQRKWQVALGIGAAPVVAESAMQRNIRWTFDKDAIFENLRKISTNSVGSGAIVGSFVDIAKSQLTEAGGPAVTATTSALGPLVLVGMGYNAFRSLCGEKSELCQINGEKLDATSNLSQEFADLVPSSETNELFRLSLVKTIQSLLDESFARVDSKQLQEVFGLN